MRTTLAVEIDIVSSHGWNIEIEQKKNNASELKLALPNYLSQLCLQTITTSAQGLSFNRSLIALVHV
jgi:adenylate cyclase class IV